MNRNPLQVKKRAQKRLTRLKVRRKKPQSQSPGGSFRKLLLSGHSLKEQSRQLSNKPEAVQEEYTHANTRKHEVEEEEGSRARSKRWIVSQIEGLGDRLRPEFGECDRLTIVQRRRAAELNRTCLSWFRFASFAPVPRALWTAKSRDGHAAP